MPDLAMLAAGGQLEAAAEEVERLSIGGVPDAVEKSAADSSSTGRCR